MTREDFELLYQLQEADSGIDARRELLAGVDDGSDLQQRIDETRAELEELEETLRTQQSRQRKLELDLAGVEEEKQEKSDRAYGGTVSDPKQLSALEKKIEELTRNAERHEDMILELLEEIDETEAAVEEQRETLEALEAEHERVVDNYEQVTTKARNEIEQLQERREELAAEIDAKLLEEYEQLRERHDGVAVAVLEDHTCSVCNVAVPRAREPLLERGDNIVKCENCRRILVLPGGGAADDER